MLHIIDLGHCAALEIIVHSNVDDWLEHLQASSFSDIGSIIGNEPYLLSIEPRSIDATADKWRIGFALQHSSIWLFADSHLQRLAVAWGCEFSMRDWSTGKELLHEVLPGPVLDMIALDVLNRIIILSDISINIYNTSGMLMHSHAVNQIIEWHLVDGKLEYEDVEGGIQRITID